ncbi:MAG TPA: acetylxylan esterase [bacterium]|nr:acetylxylan esterase [bacterium]
MTIQELENFSPCLWFYDARDQLKNHIYSRSEEAFASGDEKHRSIKTLDQLRQWQKFIRANFIKNIGILPDSNSPLKAEITGKIVEKHFTIEKIIFQSRPSVYVSSNLYIPSNIKKPVPVVLFLSGHDQQAKHSDGYQFVRRCLAQAGLAVFAIDPIGQGERMSYYEEKAGRTTIGWGVPEHDYAGTQTLLVGDCIARYFVHDAMRAIDYLETRKEIDAKRIGITGHSGGGTQSSLLMICDERISAAAPGTFIMDRKSYMYCGGAQDAEQIWPKMSAIGFDHQDILLMMAPKPVLVLAVTSDFFPIEGTRQTVKKVKRFWEMAGKPDNIQLVEDSCTHMYSIKHAIAATEFFTFHLSGKKITPDINSISTISPEKLWCTEKGQIKAEKKDAKGVFEETLERYKQIKKHLEKLNPDTKKQRAVAWLKEKVFSFRKPCELNPRFYLCESVEEFDVEMCLWWSQEGIFNHAYLFRNCTMKKRTLPVVIALWDEGTNNIQNHIRWIRNKCNQGYAVMVCDVSGMGSISPNPIGGRTLLEPRGTIHKFNDDLLWLDDSIAAMRVYDVIRACDMIENWHYLDKNQITCYACGYTGIYGRLAAIIDKRIRKVEIENSMKNFAEIVENRYYNQYNVRSIVIPGILKYFDLSDFEEGKK